jgi:hypothetical protein
MGTMTVSSASSDKSGAWPQLESGPLIAGGILIGIGGVIALTGLAIAGAHVTTATRAWIRELEVPPSELARLKWEQARTAAASGAATWREHPNSQVKLTRRSAG